MVLQGKHIYLRAIEPEDAQRVFLWENNPENWRVTGTDAPYSLAKITAYIDSIQNFRESQELRLMICLKETNEAIGTLDLYDANFKHARAQVGVLIAESEYRRRGFAKESLDLLKEYANEVLDFQNLYAHILEDNYESIALFESAGYERVGTKRAWFYERGKWFDEHLYQLWLKK